MEKKEIHFTIDGDAGENNTIINMNIEKAYNINPTAKVVNNTYNIGTREEASTAINEALGEDNLKQGTSNLKHETSNLKPTTLADTMKEPEDDIDCSVIRKEILLYVSRVRPLVAPDKKDRFMKMWEGILELDAVRNLVYKTGKQKETNFNRSLIARILHHLESRKMYAAPYKASDFAKALEGDYSKSVRGELGKFISDNQAEEIDKYLSAIGLL